MSFHLPDLLALDFDGVLCDGLREYFQSSWRAYCQIWQSQTPTPSETLEASFSKLRHVIETGWEMPVLLRALILGISEENILQNWSSISQQIVTSEQLESKNLAQTLDTLRDEWIQRDLEGWLKLHRFYPGVADKVRQILASRETEIFIITTKEGRFARQLLQQQGIEFPPDAIIGKESKRPKYETLRQIMEETGKERVWFVEDRLKTLRSLQQQADLQTVRLYLADWGYNTEKERKSVQEDSSIQLLSLTRFSDNFIVWDSPSLNS
ncbi:MAG: HAD hydrolase-like protein [Cyanobacteriota bacterium]|nr:HAD hydrolase-like protein [Cyanobacteriota bacterium]